MDNFEPYNVLLSIATNIPVLLMTAFVLQGHIWFFFFLQNVLIGFWIAFFLITLTNGEFICKIFSIW